MLFCTRGILGFLTAQTLANLSIFLRIPPGLILFNPLCYKGCKRFALGSHFAQSGSQFAVLSAVFRRHCAADLNKSLYQNMRNYHQTRINTGFSVIRTLRSSSAIRNLTLTFLYIAICAEITSALVTQGFDRGSHLVRSAQFAGFVLRSFTSIFLYIKIMCNPASCLTDKGFVMVRTCPHFAHNTDTFRYIRTGNIYRFFKVRRGSADGFILSNLIIRKVSKC